MESKLCKQQMTGLERCIEPNYEDLRKQRRKAFHKHVAVLHILSMMAKLTRKNFSLHFSETADSKTILSIRPDDLRETFDRFGPIKDVYLLRGYYTREPRGFGFVQFLDPADAIEAKYDMDGYVFLGRELTVVFAEESRRKPLEMRESIVSGKNSIYN